MAKRNGKKSLKNKKRSAEHSLLSKSRSNESCVLSDPSSPRPTLRCLVPSPVRNPDRASPNVCACQGKLANLLSIKMLDESTNDCLDVTWDDHSRQLCICQQGKSSNHVSEILSSMPSVDSPQFKQERLSLGRLASIENKEDLRLKRKLKKRDSQNLLKSLLQDIKSPSHPIIPPVPATCDDDNIDNITVQSTSQPENIERQDADSKNFDTTTKISNDENSTRLQSDTTDNPSELLDINIIDLLCSDTNIMDDLTVFSPISTGANSCTVNTTTTAQGTSAGRRQPVSASRTDYSNNGHMKTPLRKCTSLRKRLATSTTHSISLTRPVGQRNHPPSNHPPTGPAVLPIGNEDNDDENDEEMLFWSQVAGAVDNASLSPERITKPLMSHSPSNTGADVFQDDNVGAIDESTMAELLCDDDAGDNGGVLPDGKGGGGPMELSQPRVYSQQDIEAKRLKAKRKLQQKLKSF